MSQLLSTIEVVPTKRNDLFPAPPLRTPYPASTNSAPSATRLSIPATPEANIDEPEYGRLKQGRIVLVIVVLTGLNLLISLSNGFITIALPRMAADLNLPQHLLVWPTAVNYLTSGSCLLLAGSVAGVMGPRRLNLLGCLLTGAFIISCGLARTGIQLIMFRAMQGVAVSLCLPTSVAIIANAIPSGRKRNIGFSSLGFVQPIGFSLGLVLEGVILDTVGWRFSYYLCGGLALLLFLISLWALPPDPVLQGLSSSSFKSDIDWIGATIASACLALLSYILA
ncbi:putative MFS-type transporter [Lachnellula suecica]|uniref:Putative MFS-type transporter n=1 Tax=Lachnellula suecica TaxID=602035 RepID=A0A8T9C688_9HELO|nr:putative MFS-type transporter [Lachnellula suecica]